MGLGIFYLNFESFLGFMCGVRAAIKSLGCVNRKNNPKLSKAFIDVCTSVAQKVFVDLSTTVVDFKCL